MKGGRGGVLGKVFGGTNGGKCLVASREIYSPARPSRLREVHGDDDEHSKMLAYPNS